MTDPAKGVAGLWPSLDEVVSRNAQARDVARMPAAAIAGPVAWLAPFRFGTIIPRGTVFITKTSSGYGYDFTNVCHAEEDLHLVSNETLGYRRGSPEAAKTTYVGRYRSHVSNYTGLTPGDVMRILVGNFPRWEDIPDEVHMFAQDRSSASLNGLWRAR